MTKKTTTTGTQAMDRLDYLATCHEMGGERLDKDEEIELVALDELLTRMDGRDGLEAHEALDQCPQCEHAIAKDPSDHNRPRTCSVCWGKDSTLRGRWEGIGATRVHV